MTFEGSSRPAEFRRWLAEAETWAEELETALQTDKPDQQKTDKVFAKASAVCARCHAKYRDVSARP